MTPKAFRLPPGAGVLQEAQRMTLQPDRPGDGTPCRDRVQCYMSVVDGGSGSRYTVTR